MNPVTLVVKGTPIAKKRPRFARIGSGVRTYSAQQTEEGRFLWEIQQQYKAAPIEGPVSLYILFAMPIPKSASKRQGVSMLAGETQHTKKPDLDNLVKFVKDCLNGCVWKDDAQVVELKAWKKYSNLPRTAITVSYKEG